MFEKDGSVKELTVIHIVDSFTLDEQKIVTAREYTSFLRLAQMKGTTNE